MKEVIRNKQKGVRIAVLGSTRGTDLQAILDAQRANQLTGAEVVVVISNKPQAFILERARQAGVTARYCATEAEVLQTLREQHIDLIILIGYLKILSPEFVAQYPNRIMNIHPSLLPKYAGGMNLDVHAEVLKNGDRVTGCTLHYVTEQVDEGPIILQKEVPVLPNDTPETLKDRVQKAEQETILLGVRQFVVEHQ